MIEFNMRSLPKSLADIASQVVRTYTTKSPADLAVVYKAIYAPEACFLDPFVNACPRSEAQLQFLSLQRIFSHITVEPSEPVVEDTGGDTLDLSFDCRWHYFWQRESALTQRLLPESVTIEGSVNLTVDKATNQVIQHTDVWRTPSVLQLPMPVRTFNAWATNAVFRLLGWDRSLSLEPAAMGKRE